eukprot:10725023-Heterocapsa_arctica.AAC.1
MESLAASAVEQAPGYLVRGPGLGPTRCRVVEDWRCPIYLRASRHSKSLGAVAAPSHVSGGTGQCYPVGPGALTWPHCSRVD